MNVTPNSLDVNDLRLTIHEQQTLEILDASGRARLKFALDSMVGYSLHPAGIENNAIGLVERFAKVLLNGLVSARLN